MSKISKLMKYLPEILDVRKQRKVSVAKLARITGISEDRIYKWESGIGNPKAEDSKKLQDWLDNSEQVQENAPVRLTDKDKTIFNLSEANIILAKATLILAEKINSGRAGAVSSYDEDERKDTGEVSLPLSGNRASKKKRGGI